VHWSAGNWTTGEASVGHDCCLSEHIAAPAAYRGVRGHAYLTAVHYLQRRGALAGRTRDHDMGLGDKGLGLVMGPGSVWLFGFGG
jgi:hypothetical protein